MSELYFITSNPHKFTELSTEFSKNDLKITHLKMKYAELQADKTRDIALASATQLASFIPDNFIIEDSGIFVKSLKDFPGPYSSFVYQTIGWQGILKLMQNVENRSASFISVIVLREDNKFHIFEGICEGRISNRGKGEMGFGFDPIFIPNDLQKIGIKEEKTFAQLQVVDKNKISHRGKSMNELIQFLK